MRLKRAMAIGGIAVAASGALAAAYPALFRAWCLTWGATPEEALATLPGDDLLPHPDVQSTRAVTVAAPPGASLAARAFYLLVMEPGSLVMERKMLYGIRRRAEALVRLTGPAPEGTTDPLPSAGHR